MFSNSDEDLITCEHCGHQSYPEIGIGHVCQQGFNAAKKAGETWSRNYKGTGAKAVIRIAFEVECLDTPTAIQTALSGVCFEIETMDFDSGHIKASGGDDILDYKFNLIGGKKSA